MSENVSEHEKVLSLDIVSGVEGNSISIMAFDDETKSMGTGDRIYGPKPWGGGRTLYSFDLDEDAASRILENIYRVYPDCQPRIDTRRADAAQAADAETVRALERCIREAVDDFSWAILCLDVRGQRGKRMADCAEHLKNIRAALSRLSAAKGE